MNNNDNDNDNDNDLIKDLLKASENITNNGVVKYLIDNGTNIHSVGESGNITSQSTPGPVKIVLKVESLADAEKIIAVANTLTGVTASTISEAEVFNLVVKARNAI
jgi:hypothetical protein